MSNNLTVNKKFEYIVEDPFFSSIHGCFVKVDDFNNMYSKVNGEWAFHCEDLTDGMIEVLFNQWATYQKEKDNMMELSMELYNG